MFHRHRAVYLAGLGLVAAISGLLTAALPALGLFLTVADSLAPSDAIFVLEGGTPAREVEAAALFHRGYAPRVVLALARDPVPDIARKLAGEPSPQERAARVLAHAGVPAGAVVRLSRVVENSDQELAGDFAFARAEGLRRVILVTSPYHTRRVRIIWRSRYGHAITALVYPTSYERWDPTHWWRSRRYLEWTVHEVFGIANFYLGGPLRTFDRAE
jgi:uncharacterized SAM-binding protein YcdF (DUF218 family)